MADGTRTGIDGYVAIGAVKAAKATFNEITNWLISFTPPASSDSVGRAHGMGDDVGIMSGRKRPEWGEGSMEFLDSLSNNSPYKLLKSLADGGTNLALRYRADPGAVSATNPEYVYELLKVDGLRAPSLDRLGDGSATTQSVTFAVKTKPTEETE